MREATLQFYTERILRVLIHIQQHLDEDLPLSGLARVAAFSPYHFHRIFRGMVGESVKEHVRRLRLERAVMRLKHTDWPVVRIALEAGYASHEAFSRAFRAMFDESPSGFRAGRDASSRGTVSSGVHYLAGGDLAGFEPHLWGGESMRVEIKKFSPLRVAFMRHVGPYDQCGPVWERFTTWAGAEGLLGAGAMLLGVCHDDPEVTAPDRTRYDACITVDDGFTSAGDVGVQTIAGGDHAVTTHFGPYERLGATYARLFGEWLPRSGRRPLAAPCLEVYLNDPEGTSPEDLLTDVYLPLEPRPNERRPRRER